MGRPPCCDSADVKKGPWMPEEDKKLKEYIEKNGAANWRTLPKLAGLNRCGKSCRLRWINYLNPDIKRGMFSYEEDQLIIQLHSILGNKWSKIANKLPGRTDNEVKNYWNTHLRKKLLLNGIDPTTHMPRTDLNMLGIIPDIIAIASNFNNDHNLIYNALEIQKFQLLQTLIQAMLTPSMDACLDIQNMNPLTYMPSNNLVNENDFLKPVNHETYIDNGSTSLAASTKGSENYRTHEIEEQIKASESSSHNMAVPFEVWDKLTLDDFDGNHETYIDDGSTSLAATKKGSENYRTHEIEEQIKASESSSHNMAVPFEVWDMLRLDDFDGNDFGWGDANLE